MALRRLLRSRKAADRLLSRWGLDEQRKGQHISGTLLTAPELLAERCCWERFQWPCEGFRASRTAAQRLDRAQTPLSDPKPSVATYQVEVSTGDVRGAGSSAPALLRLIGDRGQSEEFVIGREEEEQGFERGSKRTYAFQVGSSLGDLRRVFVQQVEVGRSDTSTGWFLHQIVVTTPDGESRSFPCNSWIGKNDADGLQCGMERNLIPCEVPHLEKASALLLPQALKVVFGAVSIPHPEKIAEGGSKAVNRRTEGWGGEDAYFCSPGRHGIFGLGVADGVYMWKTQGIDSGLFSRTLMSTARDAVMAGADDVLSLMQVTNARIQRNSIEGSSTACLVLIDTLQGRLSSANLGDSGFLVLGRPRPNESEMHVKYHSPQQEHQFGFPYQLGHYASADSPDSAMLMTLPVMAGDVVVMGSDGLWDNISVADICAEVSRMVREGARPSRMAQHLAALAFEASTDKKGVTPYSMAASDAFNMVYNGGKRDDITVVVTQMN